MGRLTLRLPLFAATLLGFAAGCAPPASEPAGAHVQTSLSQEPD